MLRCRLRLSNCEVHSYEQNAVNLPGWLAASAIWLFSLQMGPVISGVMSAATGGRDMSVTSDTKARCCCSLLVGSVMMRPCVSGSLLTGELGVFAILVMPTYSEWSVTPIKSSGVSILMS